MAKREFVQLLHKYKDQPINGWFISQKLDGMRGFWDGGVSRGRNSSEIPWSNKEKDHRYRENVVATGLWSRMGNVIRAPDWWLDRLPPFPLDGELFIAHGMKQKLDSIVKTHTGTDWSSVRYVVLDSPPLEEILKDGDIDVRMGKILYKLKIRGSLEWMARNKIEVETVKVGTPFEFVYKWLKKKEWNSSVSLHEQLQLPFSTQEAKKVVEEFLEKTLEEGGEGVVLRSHVCGWKAERAHSALKHKPNFDDEGLVIGYKWGRKTELGSKLLGKFGCIIVSYKGKIFDLSGFTEEERTILGPNVIEEGEKNEGKIITPPYYSKYFPLNSVITFLYRDKTNDGLPKEARYWRKREIE